MKLTRKQLHEMVWKDPMTKVAATLGISDVGLAKLCRRHGIPTPARGHWAKLAASQNPPTLPLEGEHEEIVEIFQPSPREIRNTLKQQTEKDRDARAAQEIGYIEIPDQLTDPHWLTRNTQKFFNRIRDQIERVERRKKVPTNRPDFDALEVRQNEKFGRYECGPHREGFTVTVSLKHLDRALGFLDTLARELERRGFKLSSQKRPDGYRKDIEAIKDGEGIHFSLREGYNRIKLNQEEFKATSKNSFYASKYIYVGNGKFTFAMSGRENPTYREWTDGTKKIEESLPAIVAEFLDLVPRQKQIRADKERDEQRRQEEARKAHLVRMREEEKQGRFKEALNEAKQLDRLNRLESYLQLLENRYRSEFGELDPQALAWFAEIRETAAAHDPIAQRLNVLRRTVETQPCETV